MESETSLRGLILSGLLIQRSQDGVRDVSEMSLRGLRLTGLLIQRSQDGVRDVSQRSHIKWSINSTVSRWSQRRLSEVSY